MPLDWLFGTKKKSELQPLNSAEDNPSSNSIDDFVLLGNETPLQPSFGGSSMYPQLPYTLGPQPTEVTPKKEQQIVHNSLHGVPFKITTDEIIQNIDTATADYMTVLQVLRALTYDTCVYDFQVEKSVLKEVDSQNVR